jgi:putative colanic acid biosynthesis acetyltransferase WcaF
MNQDPNSAHIHNREQIFSARLHRGNDNYQKGEYGKRLLWGLTKPLLWLVPRFFYGFRNGVLRAFGARIGKAVRIYPNVDIFFPWNLEIGDEVTVGPRVQLYSLGKIRIGDGTMISYGAHLCAGTHDYMQRNLPLLKPEIRLGQGIWICTDSFIGPGVAIGDFSIVGARAVVLKSFSEFSILGGNPARKLKDRPIPETDES